MRHGAGFVLVSSIAFLVVPAPGARAMFRLPDEVPVDRLVENVGRFVAAHPEDARGHYVLARIHTLALVHKSTKIRAYLDAEDPQKLPDVDVPYQETSPGKAPPRSELVSHLEHAMGETARAIALAPDDAAYHLARAYAAEAGAVFPDVRPPTPEAPAALSGEEVQKIDALIDRLDAEAAATREEATKALTALGPRAWPRLDAAIGKASPEARARLASVIAWWWQDVAIGAYRRAYDLAIAEDLAMPSLPVLGLRELVAHEAGRAWVRLVQARGGPEANTPEVRAVEDAVRKLESKPRGAITPILVPLGLTTSLAALLPPGRTATFDLDGDGTAEPWPWPSADAAFLVWDPSGTGEITSGQQLFGSVTWWLFFRDGYEALAALDDDADGWLRGHEIEGLALWQDANGNGRSEPGEVRPLAAYGAEAISTRGTRAANGVLTSPDGLHLKNGRTLPTYDWTPTPAR